MSPEESFPNTADATAGFHHPTVRTICSLLFQSASALLGSNAYPCTPSPTTLIVTLSGNDAADVAILAVASTDFVRRSDDGGRYRRQPVPSVHIRLRGLRSEW